MKLKNTKILITGANRGIGAALSKECATRGARLVLVARKIEPQFINELKNLGAQEVNTLTADLSLRDQVEKLVVQIKSQHKDLDILVNNAGLLTGGLLEEQPLDKIYEMFQVNLLALVHLTHGLLPQLLTRKKGKIVNNASVSGVMHFPCATTYTAAKTGVVAFTEALKQEVKGTGVSTLLLLTPGIKTRMFDEISDLYAKNMDLDFLAAHLSAEEWALKVCDAMESDAETLAPDGASFVGLKMARHFPSLFEKIVRKKFRRT